MNRRNRLIGCAIIVDVPSGIQAVSLGDDLTQLMVSSAHSNAPASPTAMIVQHVVAARKAMNVECSRGW